MDISRIGVISFLLMANGLLFTVIISSVVVGVLGVLICIGVEMIGKVSGRFFILRLQSLPSYCGVLLKKSISLLLACIEV